MHEPDVEITDSRKRQLINGIITSATRPRLGTSTSSGSKTDTALGGSGIDQREGQEVYRNLKEMQAMHEFT